MPVPPSCKPAGIGCCATKGVGALCVCEKQSPGPGSFSIKTNVIIPWYITRQENMRFNLVLIVLLFIMFSPISSTILHNFIREKNDKQCYCFYYKCIYSHIQLVFSLPRLDISLSLLSLILVMPASAFLGYWEKH